MLKKHFSLWAMLKTVVLLDIFVESMIFLDFSCLIESSKEQHDPKLLT